MPLFDPALRGRYIKLGRDNGFVKVSKIARAVRGTDAQGAFCRVHRQPGEGPPIVIRGRSVDHVKRALEREGIGEV